MRNQKPQQQSQQQSQQQQQQQLQQRQGQKSASQPRARDKSGRLVRQRPPNPRVLENVLQSIYYDPREAASFSSVSQLYNAGKAKIRNLRKSDVKKWLSSQMTYVLHKAARQKFPRRKVLVPRPKHQFQADLLAVSYTHLTLPTTSRV